jgi:acyl-CoA hydrolase
MSIIDAPTRTVRTLKHPSEVMELIDSGTDLVCGMANGEPVALMDTVEDAAAAALRRGLTVHQMHPLSTRRSMTAELDGQLNHTSYFLSGPDRPYVGSGVDFVPSNFSEVPQIIGRRVKRPIVMCTVAEHEGRPYYGTNADYTAALIRDGMPAILEINPQMPYLPSCPVPDENVIAVCRSERPLHAPTGRQATAAEERIAELVAERIPNGSTLQIGVGAIPDRVCAKLVDRRMLRVHSELFCDGMVDLIEADATSVSPTRPAVATFALGSPRLYEFMDGNPSVYLAPVDEVNAPRRIAAQPKMTSICATTEVDLYGQAASATVGGRWYSGSGGQLDYMRGVHIAPDGQGFMVLPSTLKDGTTRIKPTLAPFSAVTTGVHFIDKVVTEHGVAELADRSLSERARALIAIAAPEHRAELTFAARQQKLL